MSPADSRLPSDRSAFLGGTLPGFKVFFRITRARGRLPSVRGQIRKSQACRPAQCPPPWGARKDGSLDLPLRWLPPLF